MKTVKQYFSLFAAVTVLCAVSGCGKDFDPGEVRPAVSYNADGSMNVDICFEIPEHTVTRTMGTMPGYGDLSLWVMVFETESGNLLQIYHTAGVAGESCTEHTGNALVKFTATLNPTDREATVHLLATDQPDIAVQLGGSVNGGGLGNENQLSSIVTNSDHEAYWARIPLGVAILASDSESLDFDEEAAKENARQISEALSHVIMLRNFGKVTADVAANVSFYIDEMYLVNWSDRGSIAPYLEKSFISFFTKDDKVVGRKYDDIKETGYIGEPPAGTEIVSDQDKKWIRGGDSNTPEIYFYERPYRSESRSFVVLRGRRSTNGPSLYYKIDLGKKDDNSNYGEFVYYNMLRNFDYHIVINAVGADGYLTLEDAKNGLVFNNIDASVETRNLNSISDGTDAIFVNFTSYVFSSSNMAVGATVQGQYIIPGGNETDELKIETDPNGFLDISAGVRQGDWKSWNVTVKNGVVPTSTPRQQTVIVYRGKKEDGTFGLYRVITFTLIDHFEIERMDTFPGLWENFEEVPWDWSDRAREIGQSVNSPMTLFFQLPQGLPEAVFPLEFVIESNRQNIQNAYQGNAVVQTVSAAKSLFWLDGNVTTSRIQFVKTVTWQEYNETEDNYIVRCRFLTTTDLNQDGIGTGQSGNSVSSSTLRVSNPYFRTTDDHFTRSTATSDPSPRLWNFSAAIWGSFMASIQSPVHGRVQGTEIESLMVYEGALNSMRSGSISQVVNDMETGESRTDDYSYIRTSNVNTGNNAGDRFVHTHGYPGTDARILQLYIMVTPDNDAPTFTGDVLGSLRALINEDRLVTRLKTNGNGLKEGYPKLNSETKPFPTLIYQYDIPQTETEVTIDIRPRQTGGVRFYNIEFYPRWDEVDIPE